MTRNLLAILAAMLLLTGCADVNGARTDMAQNNAQQPKTLYLDVINGLRQRGLYRAALANLDEYERSNPRTPQTILLRGQLLLSIGADAQALAEFQAIKTGPELAAAQSGIGAIDAHRGDWAGAVAAFGVSVANEPTNARYINNLGFAQLHQGDAADADYRLRMAAELDPASAEIRNNVTLLLLATGRKAEGEQMLADLKDPATQAALRREAAKIAADIADPHAAAAALLQNGAAIHIAAPPPAEKPTAAAPTATATTANADPKPSAADADLHDNSRRSN
jgi:Flp pilus assembly protein TadD